MLLGMVPFLLDMIDVATDTNAVDLPIGGKDADRDRNVVAAARAVGDVLEQERLALRLRDASTELPAHERVHFGILVDRPLHANEEAVLLERGDMRVNVRISRAGHASSRSSKWRCRALAYICELSFDNRYAKSPRMPDQSGADRSRSWPAWLAGAGTVPPHQSALAPENLPTLAHFLVSAAMTSPKLPGEPTKAIAPRWASRALIVGSARPALISLLSLSIPSTGVFLGAPMP